jgi:hypothetical protein
VLRGRRFANNEEVKDAVLYVASHATNKKFFTDGIRKLTDWGNKLWNYNEK